MNNEEIKEIIKNKWYEAAPNTVIYFDSMQHEIVIVTVRFLYKGEIKSFSNVLHTNYLTESTYLYHFMSCLMRDYANAIINLTLGDKL